MTDESFERFERGAAEALQRALARIERRVRAGEREIARTLAAVSEEQTFARLALVGAGGGELWFAADRTGMRVLPPSERPAPDAFGYAVQLPVGVATHLLGQLSSGALDDEAALLSLASLASDRARDLFGATTFLFQLEVRAVARLGAVRGRVSLGSTVLEGAPEFSLRLAASDLEAAFEEGAPPQRLFLEGRFEIDGDVAKAMLLGMLLAEVA